MADLSNQFNLLLGNYSSLDARIRHLGFDTSLCGEKVEVRGSYISFRDGEPTLDDFIDVVAAQIATFCLPRAELAAAAQLAKDGQVQEATTEFTRLVQRAQSLFLKAKTGTGRSGEAGEIILYILNEWVLKAPQIVSKMYLKTNNQMPVYGTDGIHARYEKSTDELFIYWGESKAHKSLKSALTSALKSLADFVKLGQEKKEIEIVSAFIDLGEAPAEIKTAILEYLNPYKARSNNRVAVFSCLLIFNFVYSSKTIQPDKAEADLTARFKHEAENFIKHLAKEIDDANLAPKRFEFFLLPIPDVQDLRDKFAKKIGA